MRNIFYFKSTILGILQKILWLQIKKSLTFSKYKKMDIEGDIYFLKLSLYLTEKKPEILFFTPDEIKQINKSPFGKKI